MVGMPSNAAKMYRVPPVRARCLPLATRFAPPPFSVDKTSNKPQREGGIHRVSVEKVAVQGPALALICSQPPSNTGFVRRVLGAELGLEDALLGDDLKACDVPEEGRKPDGGAESAEREEAAKQYESNADVHGVSRVAIDARSNDAGSALGTERIYRGLESPELAHPGGADDSADGRNREPDECRRRKGEPKQREPASQDPHPRRNGDGDEWGRDSIFEPAH